MCDDFIHQGLTHNPTVSRRDFGFGAAATAVALHTSVASAQSKVVETDVNVPMASGVSDSALFYPEGKVAGPPSWCGPISSASGLSFASWVKDSPPRATWS